MQHFYKGLKNDGLRVGVKGDIRLSWYVNKEIKNFLLKIMLQNFLDIYIHTYMYIHILIIIIFY